MEAVQEKVMVPTTVQKPVTRKVARERIEYVPETHVRPVQTQTTTYKPEVVSEDVIIRTPIMERIVQKVQVPQRIARSVPFTELRTVPRTYTQRVPIVYDGQIVSSYPYPIVESSTVVTAGATGVSGTAGPAYDAGKPEVGGRGKEVESGKPATTEEAPLPAPNSKGRLSIGPADGGISSSKPPAAGKIKLQDEEN